MGMHQHLIRQKQEEARAGATSFPWPNKLYGRDEERAVLSRILARIRRGGFATVLVSGEFGSGKTALLQDFESEVLHASGFYMTGTFDMQKRVPYGGILQAFEQLFQRLLREQGAAGAGINAWKEKILQAVGPNIQVLVEVLPMLREIVGEQPAVLPLGNADGQGRFRTALQKLLGVFASAEHPLVMVLDNMQGADQASQHLLEYWVSDRTVTHLLLVGCLREDDGPMTDTWQQLLGELRATEILTDIRLHPLRADAITQCLRETLPGLTDEELSRLSDVVQVNSQGNPYAAKQVLHALHATGVLVQDEQVVLETLPARWRCQLELLEAIEGFDPIAYQWERAQLVSPAARELLQVAACLGSSFERTTLQAAVGGDCVALAEDLQRLVEAELFEMVDAEQFRFANDHLYQAAYRTLPEAARTAIHLQVGRWLAEQEASERRDAQLVTCIRQLTKAGAALDDPAERIRLAQRNLEAAQLFKATTASRQALSYVQKGLELLPENAWDTQYNLTLDLHVLRYELQILLGHRVQAEETYQQVIGRAQHVLDKVKVYTTKINHCSYADRLDEAMQTGMRALHDLGMRGSLRTTWAGLWVAYQRLKWLVKRRSPNRLVTATPLATDPLVIAKIDVMNKMGIAAYHLDLELYYSLRLKMIALSLKHGLTDKIGIAFVGVGVMGMTFYNDFDGAEMFGRLGVDMEAAVSERQGVLNSLHGLQFYANVVQPWTKHNRNVVDSLLAVSQRSLELGDVTRAVFGLGDRALRQVCAGTPLPELRDDLLKHMKTFQRGPSDWSLQVANIVLGLVYSLQGVTQTAGSLSHDEFSELRYFRDVLPKQNTVYQRVYYYCKIYVLFLADDYVAIWDLIPLYTDETLTGEMVFLFALTYCALYANVTRDEQFDFMNKLKVYRKQMKKWAKGCPENFLHKSLLMEAEYARTQGRDQVALDLYEQAIVAATRHQMLPHAAMANECAGKFCLSKGNEEQATYYFATAYQAYQRWGAVEKARRLQAQYPELLGDLE